MKLPPRNNGQELSINTATHRSIVIIGANGAGKTRFADRLASDCSGPCFRMSALKALYVRSEESSDKSSIDMLYRDAISHSPLIRDNITGEFDRMTALLINEVVADVMAARYGGADQHHESRLDRVIEMWQRIYPDNRILIEHGRMLIGHSANDDTYSTLRLSAGEQATMYYIGASLFAPEGATVFVDSPDMFLHPSTVRALWDEIERMRSDCTFVYTTHDLAFASSRSHETVIWVRSFDPVELTWAYDIMPHSETLPDEMYLAILGSRKPVMFIEGDGINSIDSKLYPLVFPEYTINSLGSCDRVIEATRSFNATRSFHNLDAYGIVDRDRREDPEVRYLRSRRVLVPEVAEIENILMLEDVIKAVARSTGSNPKEAFSKVKRTIMKLFKGAIERQALQHTRHHLKKTVTYRIDGRFTNIDQLQHHVNSLVRELAPRDNYNQTCRLFWEYVSNNDYASVLRVFNQKSMVSESHVATAVGLPNNDSATYISAVIDILAGNRPEAATIRTAVRRCFGLQD